MGYIDTYNELKSKISYEDDSIDLGGGLTVRNFSFVSKGCHLLPGEQYYKCPAHGYEVDTCYNFDNGTGLINEVLDIHDSVITDNTAFRYHLFLPHGQRKAKGVVLMLHGFNEKHWHKYFPWAKRVAEDTGKAVLLFPMAFHMNRAPQEWSDTRMMFDASGIRKKIFPNIIASSLSNVAISTRIQAKPQRFIWSGLQAYHDIIQLIEQWKSGNHPAIAPDASLDMLSYSIGAFLSQILMLANHKGYFSNAKLAMFCGGAVFNRLSPVSKFILDSEANVALYSFIVEHLESHLRNDSLLRHYLSDAHPEGVAFRAMLSYNVRYDIRETAFRSVADRMMAVCLEQDTVVPPHEVVNTLQGRQRDIPIRVDVLDFPYEYKHEDPFPCKLSIADRVDESFNRTFDSICSFLNE